MPGGDAHLSKAATAFDHFDLVPIRILQEEESCESTPVVIDLFDSPRRQSGRFHPLLFGIERFNDDRDVPITITEVIGLRPPFIDRQLQLDVVSGLHK